MRINFLLPTLNPSGGVKVVKDYTKYLNDEGHDCLIYYPIVEKMKRWYGNEDYTSAYVSHRGIRDADVTIATAWDTARKVMDLPDVCGEKVYFIQHYEKVFDDRAVKTYDYPMFQIVVSHWLYRTLNILHGTTPYIVENGIKLPAGVYKDAGKHTLKVLMPWRQEEWKGTDFGVAAIEEVHSKHPDVEFHVFGWNVKGVPRFIHAHNNPTDKEVHGLMYNADIFLNPTTIEGFGLPSLEAMARMCAVVTTNVGAVPEYTEGGLYACVVEPYDVKGMVRELNSLIENPSVMRGYQTVGYEVSKRWSFDLAAKRFESCLKSLVQS
jgi:glycosyltransferase involved in cell wall biosynthesis